LKASKKYADFKEYLKDCPEDVRFRLLAIMNIIREIVPTAEERISYNMPAYFHKGRLVYFCAFKNHIGFYPASMTVFTAFREELSGYVQSGHGTVQFQHGEPLPQGLIRKIIEFRVGENESKSEQFSRRPLTG